MILLDRLCPGNMDMVAAAEHDEIWLAVSLAELAAVANESIIEELVRCRVHVYDEGLHLFV